MEVRCGPLLFTSKFDSGNLAKVEKVARSDDEDFDLSKWMTICSTIHTYIHTHIHTHMHT